MKISIKANRERAKKQENEFKGIVDDFDSPEELKKDNEENDEENERDDENDSQIEG